MAGRGWEQPGAGCPGAPAGTSALVLHVLDLSDARWDLAAAAADLSPAERARADRGVPAVRRRRLLVRAALRRVLADLLDVPARDVPLRADGGRPFLAERGLGISCSASGDVALVAVAGGGTVGVDVQRHSDDEAAAAPDEGWLAPTEHALIAALPEPARPAAVTRCWTQKEAVLKARGTGIRRLPSDVVTPVRDSGRIGPWWVTPVVVPAGHLASLATDVPVPPGSVHTVRLLPGGPR